MVNKDIKRRIIMLLENQKYGYTTTMIATIIGCHYVTVAKILNALYKESIVDEEYHDFNYRIWKIMEENN